jgi:hypothetical protein
MSLKAGDGVVEERRRFTRNQIKRPIMAAAPKIAPTAPPAIAPMFELVELDADVVESPVAVAVADKLVEEVYTEVKEADKVVE